MNIFRIWTRACGLLQWIEWIYGGSHLPFKITPLPRNQNAFFCKFFSLGGYRGVVRRGLGWVGYGGDADLGAPVWPFPTGAYGSFVSWALAGWSLKIRFSTPQPLPFHRCSPALYPCAALVPHLPTTHTAPPRFAPLPHTCTEAFDVSDLDAPCLGSAPRCAVCGGTLCPRGPSLGPWRLAPYLGRPGCATPPGRGTVNTALGAW